MKLEQEDINEAVAALDTYNSDLNLVIDASKYSAHPLTNEGFAFMWAGARATHGAAKGKFCFEVKILEHLDVSHLPVDEPNPNVVRVGVSIESSTLQLGEDPLSYGYGGTGKISTNCQFKDFGGQFIAGDCILCVVNFESDQVQIGYAKNGKFLGWAFRVNKSELQEKALFPHVLSKNCSFETNLGQREKPYFNLPDVVKDYIFIGCLPLDQRIGGTRPPKERQDCEMIMMCGLPGAGKSFWAAEYSSKNPQKKFNILGTNNIIDKMKVMGLPRKRNYAGRWDVLIQMATKCLNKMFEIGSKLRRNYILDQTNVYPTAQRRKMRNFEGFKRVAVVVVPTEEEYKRRCDKRDREEGKEVPEQAVLEMKSNFKLPEVSDIFDEVRFSELQKDEAQKLVKRYNEEGKAAMGPSKKMFRPNDAGGNKGFDVGRGNFISTRGGSVPHGGFDGGMGRGSYGGNRGGYDGGRDDFGNRGGYGGRGNHMRGQGGFTCSRGGFDSDGGFDSGRSGYNGGRAGYDGGRGGYDDGGRGGYDSGRGGYNGGKGVYDGGKGVYDGGKGSYDGGRGSYDGRRGSYDGGRGSYDGGRGSYDGGRGSYDGGRGSYDGGRGSYDGGRGGYDSGRGGYDSGRGSYDSGRGGYDGGRGGYDGGGRGGYDGGRGSYNSERSSNDAGRGGYNGGRGGNDVGRVGYDGGRGDNEGGRGSNNGGRFGNSGGRGSHDAEKGGYDSGRGGRSREEGSRGGFNGGRGGFGRGRGNFGRGSFDVSRGGRGGFSSGRSNFESGQGNNNRGGLFDRKRGYEEALGNNSGNYDSGSFNDNSSGFSHASNTTGNFDKGGSQGRGTGPLSNYSGREYNSSNSQDRHVSDSGRDSIVRSSSNLRNDNGSHRGSFSNRGNSFSGNSSASSLSSQGACSSSDYGRKTSSNYDSGYNRYGDCSDKSQSGYQANSDYSCRDASRSFNAGPAATGSADQSSIDNTRALRVRPSGRIGTRWSAETVETATTSAVNRNYACVPPKPEQEAPTGRSQTEPNYSNFVQNNPPPPPPPPPPPAPAPAPPVQGFPAAPAYAYQSPALAPAIAAQQWPAAQLPPPPPPVNPVGQIPQQPQWPQYYQQNQLPRQFYSSQYFVQTSVATPVYTPPAYGSN